MDCWWFKITPYTVDESEYMFYREDRVVRVPAMNGKTAAMLLGEVTMRTNKRNTAEHKAVISAIRRAVIMPNITVTNPDVTQAMHTGIIHTPSGVQGSSMPFPVQSTILPVPGSKLQQLALKR